MTQYRFAAYPTNSSVAAGVTIVVSVWFLVAAGAILSDPSSPYTHKDVRATAPVKAAQAQAPKVFETMYVTARTPQMYDTILVSAKRPAGRTAT